MLVADPQCLLAEDFYSITVLLLSKVTVILFPWDPGAVGAEIGRMDDFNGHSYLRYPHICEYGRFHYNEKLRAKILRIVVYLCLIIPPGNITKGVESAQLIGAEVEVLIIYLLG